MTWYKTGTASLTNASPIVYGSGSLWVDAGILNPGDIFNAPDGKQYEILSIQSNTQSTLTSSYLAATVSGAAYSIIPIGLLPSALALQVKTTLTTANAALASAVLSTAAQGLSTAQQGNARANIAALGAADVGAGHLSLSVAGGVDVALNATQAANQFIELTGTLTANINLIVPTAARLFVVYNSTAGAFSVTVKTVAGSGVAALQGGRMLIECDGTNCIDALSYMRQTGGSIDGTPIGQTTAAAVRATTLTATGQQHTFGSGGSANSQTSVNINATGHASNGGVIQFQKNAVATIFIGDTAAGLGSGTGSLHYVYGDNPAITCINGVERTRVTSGGLTVTGEAWATGAFVATGAVALSSRLTGGYVEFRKTDMTRTGYIQEATGNLSIVAERAGSSLLLYSNNNLGATLDANGNLLAGVPSGTMHTIAKAAAEGYPIFQLLGTGNSQCVEFDHATGTGYSASASALFIRKNSSTSRSINAAGTVNASGADYAEYEHNNGLRIIKGQLVGFKADGSLTLIYSEAVRFAIKSTNPSLVGGDTWGSEDAVGKRPEEPQFTAAPYAGSAAPVEPIAPEPASEDATQAQLDAYAAALVIHEAAMSDYAALLRIYNMDMLQHAASVEVAQGLFDTACYPEYIRAKAAFEDALEIERQKVDRIAYAGKVPVNVQGATPGGYIIAVDADGAIAGEFVDNPDFAQYKKAVGRVNRLLPDGRCEVAVIIH